MTTPIDSSYAVNQPKPATTVDRPDQMGKDTFLKLLVAQLKYQNPLSPADGSEFMAQTAQFSMVEKLEELSKQTTQMLNGERMQAASSMIGREVAWKDADGNDKSGVVSGVRLDAAGPVLRVDGADVMPETVTEVRQPPAV
jgi:flagellar basal-body rod modification protein FlgD